MKKYLGAGISAIIMAVAILTMCGCKANSIGSTEDSQNSQTSKTIVSENDAPITNIVTIKFPVSDKGKTEFNATIYEVEPFDLSLELPNGWTMKERGEFDADIALTGVWSILDIFNDDGILVGAVGYNTYELYEGAEEDPRAIYNQIALGNNYHFDVRDSYNVANETDSGSTAIVDVYYSANMNNGVEKNNKGIVSYNKNYLVYIAAEFVGDKITDEQVMNTAKSIQILRNA